MNKSDLTNLINTGIKSVDDLHSLLVTSARLLLISMPDNLNKHHMEWVLSHAEDSYVSYIHDLERLIKTVQGEPFAGKTK